MTFYLILCRSLTHAQRVLQALVRAGISGQLMRTPRNLSPEGCGYCVRVTEHQLSNTLKLLHQRGLTPEQIYIQNGSLFSEVSDDLPG